jgi:hypothetical protein
MHLMLVSATDALLRRYGGQQRCGLRSRRSSIWMLVFRYLGDLLRNHLICLRRDARDQEKSATRGRFPGASEVPVIYRGHLLRRRMPSKNARGYGSRLPLKLRSRTPTAPSRSTIAAGSTCTLVKPHTPCLAPDAPASMF